MCDQDWCPLCEEGGGSLCARAVEAQRVSRLQAQSVRRVMGPGPGLRVGGRSGSLCEQGGHTVCDQAQGHCLNRVRRTFSPPLLHSELRGGDLHLWGIFVSKCDQLSHPFITVLDFDSAFLGLWG